MSPQGLSEAQIQECLAFLQALNAIMPAPLSKAALDTVLETARKDMEDGPSLGERP